MSPEIERLLGGYATNTLTDEERELLLAAAVEDQEVFEALENEQALRDLLSDSVSRGLIEKALAPRERAAPRAWFWLPAAGLAAVVALVLAVAIFPPGGKPRSPALKEIASSKPADAPPPPGIPPPASIAAPARTANRQIEKKKTALEKDLTRRAEAMRATRAGSQPTLIAAKEPEPEKQAQAQAEVSPPAQVQVAVEAPPPAAPPPFSQQQPGNQAAPQPARRDAGAVSQRADSVQFSPFREAESKAAPAPAPASVPAGNQPLVGEPMSVAVLRRTPAGDFAPLAPSDVIRIGDFIRLEVRTGLAGNLTVATREASDRNPLAKRTMASLASRSARDKVPTIPVVPGERYLVPGEPILVTGRQTFTIVLTPSSAAPVVRTVSLEPGQPVKP